MNVMWIAYLYQFFSLFELAGCNKPVYVEPSGKVHDFCGRRHAAAFNGNASATGK